MTEMTAETTEFAEVAPTSFEEALKSLAPLSTAPFPYTDLQTAWLNDLESAPAHLQGTNHLLSFRSDGDSKPGFCCLGRACLIAGATPRVLPYAAYVSFEYKGDSDNSILPVPLADEMQMHNNGSFRRHNAQIWASNYNAEIPGYGSYGGLAEMNDGAAGKRLTFRQIAAFIRHDPWRVFAKTRLPETAPVEAAA